MVCFSFANIILVFKTSKGVVTPAATAPATLPKIPLSKPEMLSRPCVFRLHSFITSHNGNCMTVNGTSRNTVIPHPLYISFQTPSIPMPPTAPCGFLSAQILRKAARELGDCNACALCFTTSVGTRIAQAATSPTDAATICSTGSLQAPHTPGDGEVAASRLCWKEALIDS